MLDETTTWGAGLDGQALTADELVAIPDFSKIKREIWSKYPGAVARKTFAPGEIVCREGASGATAFYLQSGQAEAFISNPIATANVKKRSSTGLLNGLTHIADYLKRVPR